MTDKMTDRQIFSFLNDREKMVDFLENYLEKYTLEKRKDLLLHWKKTIEQEIKILDTQMKKAIKDSQKYGDPSEEEIPSLKKALKKKGSIKEKKITPSLSTMKRIAERVERRKFASKLEKQGNEYLIRFNWDNPQEVKGFTAISSIIYKEMGTPKKPILWLSGQLYATFSSISKETFEKGNKCFEQKVKPKFSKSLLNITSSYSPSTNYPIRFSANFPLESKKQLTESDLDIISDFIHNSFACWLSSN